MDPASWEIYLGPLRQRARAHATPRLYGVFVTREFPRVLLAGDTSAST